MNHIISLLILSKLSLAFHWNGTSILEGSGSEFTETEKEMIRNVFEDFETRKTAVFLTGVEYIDDEYNPFPFLQEFRIKNSDSNEDDVFILKLNKFSPEEIRILDVVTEYDQKCYMILIVDDDQTFKDLERHILDTSMFNVYLVKKSTNPQIYLIYKVCAFCNGSQHEMKYNNAWKKGNGFMKQFQFLPSFSGDFNG